MRKMIPIVLALAAALTFSAAAQAQTDAQDRPGSGLAHLRRQPGPGGLCEQGRQWPVVGLRRRFLPRARGGDLQRPVKGAVRAAVGFGSVRRSEEQADRRAVAQFDLDHGSRRRLRRRVYRRDLLRRPGVSCPQEPRTSNRRSNSTAARSACSRARRPSPISSTFLKPTI